MMRKFSGVCVALITLSGATPSHGSTGQTYVLENEFLKRSFVVRNSALQTEKIVNKRTGATLTPLECSEFRLRVSQGTEIEGTDRILQSSDFAFKQADRKKDTLSFQLHNVEYDIAVTVNFTLLPEDFYLRKHLVLRTARDICIERLDIEALAFEDAYQPCTIREITAQSNRKTMQPGWRPGLGQPLFTLNSGTFWGVEFPAAYNYVENKQLFCGYQFGRILRPGQDYQSYNAVMGCIDK